MSFYQKYRPKDFNSICWQEFIKTSLQNALKQNKTVWVYLFYWSRWTWKTSMARILAKWFNCLNLLEDWNPCLECINCKSFENEELLDIIEIDAASNTWVDNVRDIIDKARFQPNQAKYKVYIIDEVHMLSKWAFNALLKILEEPPIHVKFILATTEIHKIPDTIISRTQRYDFKKINIEDIVERLKFISRTENIFAEEEALKLIARISKGSLRDAISFLEQYSIWWNLKLEYLKHNLQIIWDEFLEEFIQNLILKDKINLLKNLSFLKDKWIDIKNFLEETIYFIRWKLIDNYNEKVFDDYIAIYELFEDAYKKIKFVPDTFILLEITIVKFIHLNNKIQVSLDDNINKTKNSFKVDINKIEEPAKKQPEEEKIKEKELNKEIKIFDIDILINSIREDHWKWFIAITLKNAQFNFLNNDCNVLISSKFNFEKINTPEIRSYLNNKIKDLFNLNYNIIFELKTQNLDNLLKEAKDIF